MWSFRSRRRHLGAQLAFVLVLVAAPAAAASEPALTVPGWRIAYETTRLAPLDPTIYGSGLRLDADAGLSGIDQIVSNPSTFLTVTATVAAGRSRSALVLEWTDAAGSLLARREHELPPAGSFTAPAVSPPRATALRVLALRHAGPDPLRLRRIQVRDAAGELLANPDLAPAGCPVAGPGGMAPYGSFAIAGWGLRTAESSAAAAPGLRRRDPVIRVSADDGPAGLSQFVRAPDVPFEVTFGGNAQRGRTVLLVSWSAGTLERGRAAIKPELLQRTRVLNRDDGEQTFRFRPERSGTGVILGVAVVQLTNGRPLEVWRISASASGRELLRNPELLPPRCPLPRVRPGAAHVLRPDIRWPLTAIALAMVALGIAALRRLLRDPATAPRAGSMPERLAIAGVALLPLVSVGTVKLGVRIIWCDWLFTVAALLLVWRQRGAAVAPGPARTVVAAATALVIVSSVSLALGLALFSEANLTRLSVGPALVAAIGSPEERGLVDLMRLAQGVAALFVIGALVRDASDWLRIARIVALTGIFLAIYGAYQVGSQALLGSVLSPPGSFRNPATERASGTFQEPIAYAGFLVFAAACAAVLLVRRPGPLPVAALIAAVGGVLLSQSSAGMAALAVLLIGLFFVPRRGLRLTIVAVFTCTALSLTLPAVREPLLDAVLKPTYTTNSTLDRVATWGAGVRMGATYAPIGVGRGQFAFNFAPFVSPENVTRGGRAQSALVEFWAESGPAGFLAVVVAILAAPIAALRVRRGGSVDRASVRAWWALTAGVIAVLATYYTSGFAWIWVALGLIATGTVLASAPESVR